MFQGFACMIAGDHRSFVFGDELFRHVLVFWLPFKAYMEHSALCSILECYDVEYIAFKGLQYLYSTPTKKIWSWMWRLFFVAWFMIDNWITNALHTKLTFFPIISWDLNVIERYKNSNTLNEMQSIFIGLLILIKGNVARELLEYAYWNEIDCKARTRTSGAIVWTCSKLGRLNTRLYQGFPTHCACLIECRTMKFQ